VRVPADPAFPQKFPARLAGVLVAGAAVQSTLGLWRRNWYVDDPWVKDTWLGNDAVTLLVVVPLLLGSFIAARHGSTRAFVLWSGLVAYCGYNYAFYLFGAALNVFFPLYVTLVLTSAALLARILTAAPHAKAIRTIAAPRWIGAWLLFVGCALGAVWLFIWARFVFFGQPTPIAVDEFRLVAALDLTIITPALVSTGVLIWRRHAWGDFGGALAATGGGAYLLVLAVNSSLAWAGGNAQASAEAALWSTLSLLMLASAAVLLAHMPSSKRVWT
jgi:hypothetical protein